MLSYGMARWGGTFVLVRLGPRVGLTPERIAPLERRFERWGGSLVVATRCLLTGLALPTNLIAGVGGYPARRFLVCAMLGEGAWTVGLMTLGFWYGSNWVALLGYIEDASSTLTTLVVAAVLGFILFRLLRPRADTTSPHQPSPGRSHDRESARLCSVAGRPDYLGRALPRKWMLPPGHRNKTSIFIIRGVP
jgi:membrane protein DedA with SNARE-associated domain